MLVEDEPAQRSLVAQALTAEGYRVDTAHSGLDALDRLHDRFDLVISDIDLGEGMNGLSFVEMMRFWQPELPVIVASARAPGGFDSLSWERALYLRKPYTKGVLMQRVREIFADD